MLTYFPTPYPNEWWYSVLCRYYLRSGIREHQTVKRILFNGNCGAHMGTVFPNGTIAQVVNQLPHSIFSTEEIILNHTPFLYFTRIYPLSEKKAMLQQLCNGNTIPITHLWKNYKRSDWKPKCCPYCMDEDRNRYGESYWHTEHQIPIVTVCQKHQCRLYELDIPSPLFTLNHAFHPLEISPLISNNAEPLPWEIAVSKTAEDYFNLPLDTEPTWDYNNIIIALMNNGYRKINRIGSITIEPRELYNGLIDYYGKEAVGKYFGETIDAVIVNRISNWKQLLCDRYILLQTMIKMTTETVFGNKIADTLQVQLQVLSDEHIFRTSKELISALGIKPYELNSIADYYGIEPFWASEKKKCQSARKGIIRCTVDKSELAMIERISKEKGYSCIGNFVLDCVRYVIGK